jgi:hypothetical protein
VAWPGRQRTPGDQDSAATVHRHPGYLNIFLALTLLYATGRTIRDAELASGLAWLGNTFTIGQVRITTGVVAMLIMYAFFAFVLRYTAWGRHVYAVGDDAESARLAGIQVQRVLLSVYVVARRDLRDLRLDPHRPGQRGQPELRHRRQPRLDHGGGDRRDEPLRWTRHRTR